MLAQRARQADLGCRQWRVAVWWTRSVDEVDTVSARIMCTDGRHGLPRIENAFRPLALENFLSQSKFQLAAM
jgi:hypothetical protein